MNLRNTPLIKVGDNTPPLTPALWYALGVAGLIHAFAEPDRLPLSFLHARRPCSLCSPGLLSEGLALQLDVAHLRADGLNLLKVVLSNALRYHGLGVELHTEPRAHLAIYVEDSSKLREIRLPAERAEPFPNTIAVVHAQADDGSKR